METIGEYARLLNTKTAIWSILIWLDSELNGQKGAYKDGNNRFRAADTDVIEIIIGNKLSAYVCVTYLNKIPENSSSLVDINV